MTKISILLNEGPKHEQKIDVEGPLTSGEHFHHEGYLYRVINNGQYAQCCGRVSEAEATATAEPTASAKKKTTKKPAKKKAAKKKAKSKPKKGKVKEIKPADTEPAG
jgi:hypothetical protein